MATYLYLETWKVIANSLFLETLFIRSKFFIVSYKHKVLSNFLYYYVIFSLQSQAIVIARLLSWLLLLLLFKNLNVAYCLKNIKRNLEYLLFMTKSSCKTRDIFLKAILMELFPYLIKHFK